MIRDVCCYVKVFPRLPSRQICLRRDADICAVIPHGHAEAYVSDLRADAGVSRHHRDAGSPGRQDRHGLLCSVWAALRTDERHWNVLRLQPLAATLSVPAGNRSRLRACPRRTRKSRRFSSAVRAIRQSAGCGFRRLRSGRAAGDGRCSASRDGLRGCPISSSTASSGVRSGRFGRSGGWRPAGADSKRDPNTARRRYSARCRRAPRSVRAAGPC